MNKIHDFSQLLKESDVRSNLKYLKPALKKHFPTIVRLEPASLQHDKAGVDIWVHLKDGTKLGIDYKLRNKDYCINRETDVILETWSVIGSKVGWTLDENKITDCVLFIYKDTGRSHCYDFGMLREIFRENVEEWKSMFKVNIDRNTDYNSESIIVPTKVIERKLQEKRELYES